MIFYDFIFMIMTKTLMIILKVMGSPNNHQVVYVYVCLYSENTSSCLIVGWWLGVGKGHRLHDIWHILKY